MPKKEMLINVPEGNMIDNLKKKEIFEKLAEMPMDDLQILEKFADSPKAVAALRKNKGMLFTMYGIK